MIIKMSDNISEYRSFNIIPSEAQPGLEMVALLPPYSPSPFSFSVQCPDALSTFNQGHKV